MKWCFLLNQIDYFHEFGGKLCREILRQGDECILAANSKLSEYSKRHFYPEQVKLYSKVDWCKTNYRGIQMELDGISWKEFFPSFDRKRRYRSFTYEQAVDIIGQVYQFLDFVFRKEKPDVVINEVPANIFNWTAFHICKTYGIKYLGFIGSRIWGRIDVYDEEWTCSKYQKTFQKLQTSEISKEEKRFAKEFIDRFVAHTQLPSYQQPLFSSRLDHIATYLKREGRMLSHRLRYLAQRHHFWKFDYETEISFPFLLSRFIGAPHRLLTAFLAKRFFESPVKGEKFFLFPLHLQPEASTSVLATYFSDQVHSVQNAAFALPFPYKLYVKEHPSALGENSLEFYRKLKEIPNVVLLSPFADVKALIENSQGVITLSSTVGMEAALLGKPVYILGNVFYSYHPMCRKVQSFNELQNLLKEDTVHPFKISDIEKANLSFLISYVRNTIPGDIRAAHRKQDTNNYKTIYNEIQRLFL